MTLEEFKNLEENYKNKIMDVFEYLALIPDEYLPNREELMKILEEKKNETDIS